MSYDLYLFFRKKPTRKDCKEFFRKKGFRFEWTEKRVEFIDGSICKNGKGDEPLFWLVGPDTVEPEDFPDEVEPYLPSPGWKVVVSCRSFSGSAERGAMEEFALYLARLKGGALYDPQRGKVLWPKKMVKKPSTGKRKREIVSSVTFNFWFLEKKGGAGKGRRVLESLSNGFGKKIPLFYDPVSFDEFRGRGRVPVREKPEYFLKKWGELSKGKDHSCEFKSKWPFFYAMLGMGPVKKGCLPGVPGESLLSVHFSFSVDGRVFQEGGNGGAMGESLVAFFRGNCLSWECFFANAYVERGYVLERGVLWCTGEEEEFPCAERYKWGGIPGPWAWLLWFGAPYAGKIEGGVKKVEGRGGFPGDAVIEEVDGGLFIRMGKKPVYIEKLKKAPWRVPERFLSLEAKKLVR